MSENPQKCCGGGATACEHAPVAPPNHRDSLNALSRIEGQVRGIRKMVEDGRYCMDILVQTRAIHAALRSVERQVLKRHLEMCVQTAMAAGTSEEQAVKIAEIVSIFDHDASR